MDARNSQEANGSDVMESMGVTPTEEANGQPEAQGEAEHDDLPKGVKERLGRQQKSHQREMRAMQQQLAEMQARIAQSNQPAQSMPSDQGNAGMQQPDDPVQRAVHLALAQRDQKEREMQEAVKAQHVHQQYAELQKHLNDAADKYDDFHEKVLGQNVPFTPQMRDSALLLPKNGPGSAAEVLYKLGKNPDELDRISKLHPVSQAQEMIALSHGLIANADKGKDDGAGQSRPMNSVRSTPVNNASRSINEKTPISELRAKMKDGWGKWK
jgi:hypothetical protein